MTTTDLSTEELQLWKAELNRKLSTTVGFFYGNFVHGVRRCIVDGIEPADRAADSFQVHLFEYIYHQILRNISIACVDVAIVARGAVLLVKRKDAPARGIKHICWDGCMFPNETMMKPDTWNSILAAMLSVQDAHGWKE